MGKFQWPALMLCLLFVLCAGCDPNNKTAPPTNETGATAGRLTGKPSSGGYSPPQAGTYTQANGKPEDSRPLRLMFEGASALEDTLANYVAGLFGLRIEAVPLGENESEAADILSAADDWPDLWQTSLEPAKLHALTGGAIRNIPEAFINPDGPLGEVMRGDSMLNAFKALEGGAYWYVPCVNDRNSAYTTGGTRLFYRKDWAAYLNLPAPETTEDLHAMAVAFAQQDPDGTIEADTVGLAADTASCFAYLFGIDPARWIWENDVCLPAYYSEKMLAPLAYARRLYEEGLLVFTGQEDTVLSLTRVGILAANGGDAEALSKVLSPVADAMKITMEEAYADYIGVMEIPRAPGQTPVWPHTSPTTGWVARAGLDDETLHQALALFDWTLTEEARVYARYGMPGLTYTQNDKGIFLFTDPETNRAYDLATLYPAGGYLGLITRDMSRMADVYLPSAFPYTLRAACAENTALYYRPADTAFDAMCRTVAAPARDALAIDYDAYFQNIVISHEPLEDIFERFRAECRKLGIENAVSEVTALMRDTVEWPTAKN